MIRCFTLKKVETSSQNGVPTFKTYPVFLKNIIYRKHYCADCKQYNSRNSVKRFRLSTANKRQLCFVWYGVFVSLWKACLRCRWYWFFYNRGIGNIHRSYMRFKGGVAGRNTQGIYFHYFHRFTANTQHRGAVKAIETCLRCITQYLVFFSIAQLIQGFLWIRRPLSAGN